MTKPAWAPTAERLNDAVNRLVAASQPLKVILFGSHARGEAEDRSRIPGTVEHAARKEGRVLYAAA